jgi:DNA-binding CsgD family transcriptional regulator
MSHPTTSPVPPDGRRVDSVLTVFYAVVALVALAGQAGAAVEWLHWPLPLAVGAVGAVEFGGIVLSVYSDHRRRLGERAYAARLLSATVAAGAVAVNWIGHHDRLQGGFFAGMSALGYLVWLLHSGARRRDQLRATGNLPPVPPAYGLWHWLRSPVLTHQARTLALADPTLGLYGSLHAAREQVRTATRQAAIAQLLRRKLTAGRDRLAGEIAVTVYDLDTIAARLAAAADYDGLTALIATDLTPTRLTGTPAAPTPTAGQPSHPASLDASPTAPTTTPAAEAAPDPTAAEAASTPARRRPAGGKRQPSAAERVAKAIARSPKASDATIAARLDLSEATVRRHRRHAVDSVSTQTATLHAA